MCVVATQTPIDQFCLSYETEIWNHQSKFVLTGLRGSLKAQYIGVLKYPSCTSLVCIGMKHLPRIFTLVPTTYIVLFFLQVCFPSLYSKVSVYSTVSVYGFEYCECGQHPVIHSSRILLCVFCDFLQICFPRTGSKNMISDLEVLGRRGHTSVTLSSIYLHTWCLSTKINNNMVYELSDN